MIIAPLAAALLASLAPAQGAAADLNCATPGACRHVDKIDVRVGGGNVGELTVNRDIPWVTVSGDVVLSLGDTAVFRLEAAGDKLKPVLVQGGPDSVAHVLKDGEIRIRFIQDATRQVTLLVDNRLPTPFHFDAIVQPLEGPTHAVPICASIPGMLGLEGWDEPLAQVVLTGWASTDRKTDCWSEAAPPPALAPTGPRRPLGPAIPPS